MTNFLDSFERPYNPAEDEAKWAGVLGDKYPNLTLALMGDSPDRKNGPIRPPMSLIISKKNGKLRFLLSSPDSARTYFGPDIDANDCLGSIESSLERGLGEWITKPNSGSGKNGR